jgi:hypothetical protein
MAEAEKSKSGTKSASTTPVETAKPKRKSRLAAAVQTGVLATSLFGGTLATAGPAFQVDVAGVGKNVAASVEVAGGGGRGGVAVSGAVSVDITRGGLSVVVPEAAFTINKGWGSQQKECDGFFANCSPSLPIAPAVRNAMVQTVRDFWQTNPGQIMSYVSQPTCTTVYVQQNGIVLETDQVIPLGDGSVVIKKTVANGLSLTISAVRLFEASNGQAAVHPVNAAMY